MYLKFFGLEEKPFSIAPDPRYLYMSERYREALAHLLYGIDGGGGFVILTGEVGTGKTTVCRCLLEQVPENTHLAFVLNPKVTVPELLATICDEFGIPYDNATAGNKSYIDKLNQFLLEEHGKGKNSVLLIDEAQNLRPDVLEQLRLLTNLETNSKKLLQIILLGQPELRQLVEREDLRQVAQRITARYHLHPLSAEEIGHYIQHRLAVAGCRGQIVPPELYKRIHSFTGGIPRLINVLMDRALLGAYTQGKLFINKSLLDNAAEEVLGRKRYHKKQQAPKSNTFGNFKQMAWPMVAGLGFVSLLLMATIQNKEPKVIHIKEPATVVQPAEPVIQEKIVEVEKRVEVPPMTWPADNVIEHSELTAHQAILQRWGITYDPTSGVMPCEVAIEYGLRCQADEGSWQSIRLLNRPMVLTLRNNKGQQLYAAMVSMTDDLATLMIGNQPVTLPLKAIEPFWYGDFSVIWMAPPGHSGLMQQGSTGEQVVWLRESLNTIIGVENLTSKKFDADLTRAVEAFQRKVGVASDGIVGVQTLIQINNFVRRVPLLRAYPAEVETMQPADASDAGVDEAKPSMTKQPVTSEGVTMNAAQG
jgi:general secretion pathway protein A